MKNLSAKEIMAKVQEDMNKKIDFLENKYSLEMKVDLVFDLKSSRTLGSVKNIEKDFNKKFIHSKIRLDYELIKEFGQLYLDEVLFHELVHMVVGVLHPYAKAHGKEFNSVCRAIGIETGATTNLFSESKVLKKRKEKLNKNKVAYKCSCDVHMVTKRMHNSIQEGRSYRCSSCQVDLVLV